MTLVDAEGNKISLLADIIGFDPAYDLAVLKVSTDIHINIYIVQDIYNSKMDAEFFFSFSSFWVL